jgi:acetoin utilization deacetylase AcuC-like enzyme
MSARPSTPSCTSAYVFSPRYLEYDLGPGHPLRPQRLAALSDLAGSLGLLDGATVHHHEPREASDDELRLAHADAYIAAVKALSDGDTGIDPDPIGLGPGDTPAFPGMHGTASTIVGGTLAAVRAVLGRETEHAFNPGGGLHHAMRDRASGFCVYNDLVVAIADAVVQHGIRVMYIDLDVHHGDGVQAAFYDDPRVLTVSFHETGRYLFPGTGAVPEVGAGAGVGYCVNVPLAAFTEDDSWLEAVTSLLPPLAERFQPDLIVSQHGCDGHVWDGQSHLLLTMRVYRESARLLHRLAHQHCEGRWVATGGGGYDPVRVVPRAWASVWAEMSRGRIPTRLPAAWRRRWMPEAEEPFPSTMTDPPTIVRDIPRRPQIEAENRATVARVRDLALSSRLKQAYRPAGVWTPRAVASFPPGRTKHIDVNGRPLIIRERVPPSLLRRLHVAHDMHAFTRTAERETQLLRALAARPEVNLTVAFTPEGEIVGEVALAPGEGRWGDLDGLYELAIQVARSWRHGGLGESLLRFAVEPEYTEELILIALGIAWHWDLESLGMTPDQYRQMLVRAFKPAGFQPFTTDDPEILAGEGNVLVARIGNRVSMELEDEFDRRLTRRQSWYGF